MSDDRSTLKPLHSKNCALRQRLDWKGELMLATAPTTVVLGVLA